MLAQVKLNPADLASAAGEELADTVFEIGRHLSRGLRWAEASEWLQKAHDILSGVTSEKLSNDAEELQIGITHAMARALINSESQDMRERAWDIVRKMSLEYGDRLIVLLLKLDLLAVDPAHSSQDYCDILCKIIRTVHLTDSNFKTIIHHVHKLRVRDARAAHKILTYLLEGRLCNLEQPKWLEKIVVTAVWNCTASEDFPNAPGLLQGFLEKASTQSKQPLGSTPTHAAQTVGQTCCVGVQTDVHSLCGNA